MGLASALSTALTGLTAAETTIDVVGNNLANSNTVGFKASTASFSTQFLQTLALGSQPTTNNGGTNPRQVGLGTMVSDITPNFNQGTLEISSNPTDLAIQGDGFFMVEGNQGETLYTRNGIFKFNSNDEIATITGNRLLGFGVDDQYQIQRTTLQPIEIPLGSAAVAQPTANVFLEGTLSPTGDVANQAQRIQTEILGDANYTAPPTAATVETASPPSVSGVLTSSSDSGGAMPEGTTWEYKVVWAKQYSPPPPASLPPLSEGLPSDIITATVQSGQAPPHNSITLDSLPASPVPTQADFTHMHIYRRQQGTTDFHYVDEIAKGTTTYTDTAADVTANATLDATILSGNYRYYVTYADTPGGPGSGIESRPSPITSPVNVVNGRVFLNNIPDPSTSGDPADAIWAVRRVYRSLATDDSSFHYVGELPAGGDDYLVDNFSDATISANATIDLDGPKVIPSTRLVDILSRDGSTYSQVFKEGTLHFTGKKGGRSLETKDFTIASDTTIQQLINFMDQSLGIQSVADDPTNPIPSDSGSGQNPGGMVSADGRIILTGNNGVDNAVDIGLSGMLLETTTGTENVNMPWGVLQQAVGESAVTDFLAYDSLGVPLRVRVTAVLESRDSSSTTYRWFADSADNDPASGAEIAVGTGLITFDGEGNLVSVSEGTVSVDRRNVSSASPLEFELDFSAISGLATENSTLAVSRQDGSGPGTLTSFIVGEDGVIRGVFSNGITRDLGQIRLARFSNPAGLEQQGENLYSEGVNSGLPVEGDPGQQGIGNIIAGAVELSNADIGGNLIDLILASTMYRGNTRVITTVQQMIDELLSLRR